MSLKRCGNVGLTLKGHFIRYSISTYSVTESRTSTFSPKMCYFCECDWLHIRVCQRDSDEIRALLTLTDQMRASSHLGGSNHNRIISFETQETTRPIQNLKPNAQAMDTILMRA
jgi:spore coat protein CotH